jgi:hypothetical protein
LTDPRLLAGLAVGGGFYWAYTLLQPGGSVVSAFQEFERLLGSITLSPEQREMVTVIGSEANRLGYGWLATAMVANAYAESRLNPRAVGDGGSAIGLFQVHPWGGSVETRMDPARNTALILGDVGVGNVRRGGTNRALTRQFAQYVERCAACTNYQGAGYGELDNRESLLVSLYGATVADATP